MFFFSPGITSDMLRSTNYSAIIGPQCSQVCSLVGRLASYHNIACFSGVCQDTEMLNKNVFTVSESHFNFTFSLASQNINYNIHVYKFCSVTAVTVFLSYRIIHEHSVDIHIYWISGITGGNIWLKKRRLPEYRILLACRCFLCLRLFWASFRNWYKNCISWVNLEVLLQWFATLCDIINMHF